MAHLEDEDVTDLEDEDGTDLEDEDGTNLEDGDGDETDQGSVHSTVSSLKRYDLTDSDDEDLTKRVVGPNPEFSALSPLEKLRLQLGDEVAKEFCDEDFIIEKLDPRELITVEKIPSPPPNDGRTWRNSSTARELAEHFLTFVPENVGEFVQLPEEILNDINADQPVHLVNWHILIFCNVNEAICNFYNRTRLAYPVLRENLINTVVAKIEESARCSDCWDASERGTCMGTK